VEKNRVLNHSSLFDAPGTAAFALEKSEKYQSVVVQLLFDRLYFIGASKTANG